MRRVTARVNQTAKPFWNTYGSGMRSDRRWDCRHWTCRICFAERWRKHSIDITGKGKILTKKPIPKQADLEPTKTERHRIWADVVARNAERTAQGLLERDVALMVELALTRHRALKYQDLLAPYREVCLSDIQKPDGSGPSPAEYRDAVAKAERRLLEATGIVSPKSMMASEIAEFAPHHT